MPLNLNYDIIFRQFSRGSSGGTFWCLPPRTAHLAFVLAAMLAMTLVVAYLGVILHTGEPWQVTVLNPDPHQPAAITWPILDLATSALLPGYAFAQVQGSTPPTFDSSELNILTGVLTITFSETIDATPATNIVPTKIHIRESGNYTGGITLSAGEIGTTIATVAADGTTISFTLTKPHLTTVARLATPELTIEPGAVRDMSGNTIEGTFDISTAVFVDDTSIRSHESLPSGMAFSNDGLKMFVVGPSEKNINEYTLSTAFDVSTLRFVSSTSISNQTSSPSDMAFSNDGLRMFVVGYSEKNINEYKLSTAFDASTREFFHHTTVRLKEERPTGITFSNDGLKMFVVGSSEKNINEYTLSTAFYVFGRDYFIGAFSIETQESDPRDVAFSNDGLKMFVVGRGESAVIHEYTLSTAFDVSTAAYVDPFSISFWETSPTDMEFSNDGAKMFVVGISGKDINEYTLNSVYPITVTAIPPDITAPTLASIERYNPAAENTYSQTLVYKVTFSENVTGVDTSDFTLSSDSTGGAGGGTSPVTGISGSGNVYNATVSALQEGTYNLDLVSSGHGIIDAAVNPLTNTTPTTGTDHTYTVDTTAPTLASIERYGPAAENTDSQTLVYKVTFSENVTGVDTSDFTLSLGSPGSGQFMQARTPAVTIPYDQIVTDTILVTGFGNATSVSVAVNIAHQYVVDLKVDLIAPDGTVQTLHDNPSGPANIDKTYTPDFGSTSIAGNWTLQVHDNFSEDDGILNNWTLAVNYDPDTTVHATSISGSDDVYYATFSAAQDGTYNLDLVSSGHGIEDIAENPLTSIMPTSGTDHTYTVITIPADVTAPTLASIERYNPAAENTDSQTLVYKVTFSENVMGVDTDDFVLSSGSTGDTTTADPVTSISGSGSVYYAAVFASTDGTYNLDLVSSGHGIEDIAENPLTNIVPTSGTDHTYTVSTVPADAIAPTLASIERYNPAAENTDSQTLVYKVTFSESVTGVNTSDFTLSPGSTGNGNGTGSGQFTQTRTPAITIPYDQIVTDTILVTGSGTATSVSVAVDIAHPYIDDLKVDLIAPDGTVQTLHDHSSGPANIDQTYTPDFDSASIAGNWTLQIYDKYSADDGILNIWTLTVNYDPDTTAHATSISGSGDVYYATLFAVQNGTYNLDLVSSGHGIEDIAENPLTNIVPTSGTDHTYTVSTVPADATAPTLASIERYNPAAENTDSQTLVYKVTFSENVTGVDTDDFVLSSGSTSNTATANPVTSISGSGSVYYAAVFASTDGTYNLDLVSSGHGIEDIAENPLTNIVPTTGTDHTYTISTVPADATAPTLASIERYNPAAENTDSQTLVYKVTFSENVTGVDTDDFVLSSGSTSNTATANPVTSISGSGSVYYAAVFASTDGTYNLDLVSSGHGIEDIAENPLTNIVPTTGTDHTYTVSTVPADATAPTLASIERYNPAAENTDSQTLVYKVTFSENVTGVDTDDFVLSSGSTSNTATANPVTSISGSGSVYYAAVFASTDGTYNLDLVSSGHGIEDIAENPLTNIVPTTGTDHTYTVSTVPADATAPTLASIERYNPAAENTDSQTLVYKVTFSENVTGVDTDDFVLSSGSTSNTATANPVTSISGSGSVYYAAVFASTDGTYNLDLVSSGHNITDAAANPLTDTIPTTGTDHTYTVSTVPADATAPTLASIERYNPAAENTDSQTLVYKVTFSENVTGVDTDDFVLSSGSTSNIATANPVTSISGSGSVYYAAVFASTDGTYNLDLVSSGHNITDAAANPLTDTIPTTGTDHTYTVSTVPADAIAPTLASIERYNPAAENTDSQTLVYKVTFSENVTGVDTSDFTLSPGSTGNTATANPVTSISGSGSVYYAAVFASTDGTYNLDLVSSGHNITDAAANPLTDTIPTTGTDHTYTVSTVPADATAPTLASIERYNPAAENTDSQTLVYKVTFSENVTGVDTSDFTLSPGSTGNGTDSEQFTQTRMPAITIPYDQIVTDTILVTGSGTATSVSVAVDITHQYVVDLKVDLIAPDGTVQTLHDRPNGPANINQTYAPDFGSVSIAGNWTLQMHDDYSADDGILNSWTLTVNHDSDIATHVTSISGSGNVYYATLFAVQDGTYNLDLVSSGHNITDAAANPLTDTIPTTGTDHTYTVSTVPADATAPTLASIERYNPAAENTDSQTLVYKVTFSENVTGVDTTDFTLSPGSTGTGSGQFTQTRTPAITIPYDQIVTDTILVTGSGTATSVSVAVDIAHPYIDDLKIDLIAPNGTVQTLHDHSIGSANINQTYAPDFGSVSIAGNWTLQIYDKYSADDGILNSWTLTVNHDSDIATHVTSISGSGNVYYATLFAVQDGTYNLDLVSSGHNITDAAANPLTDTIPTTGTDHTYTVSTIPADAIAPTLASIERYNPAAENTNSQTLVYKVTFSENVTGVDTTDFTLSPDSTGGSANNTSEQFTQTQSPSLAIPDMTTVSDTIAVPDSGTATSVSVSVYITHAWIGDLLVELIAPDGTTRTLHNREGGGVDDIDQTYTPDFGDVSVAGTWTLRIYDGFNADPGVLNSWMLTVNHDSDPAIHATSISGSGDVYYVTISAAQEGTYNLDLVSSDHGITGAAGSLLTDTIPTETDHTYTVSTAI